MGKKEGEGEYIWSNGCKYKGNWHDNKLNGFGIYYYNDGRIYEGEFVDNFKEGKGKMIWKDGRKYFGFFKKDKKNGIGIFFWSDGRIYVGFWNDNKQNGFGKYVNGKDDGTKFGIWENGKKKEWIKEEDVKDCENEFHQYYELVSKFEEEAKNEEI